ncbi:MAG: penicillin-binding transpeptidase domain-containing protein [Firmicutes bacterium]|nr:penicillin-binding transpeptidase domain-containing protein [Bacillota bacterium]
MEDKLYKRFLRIITNRLLIVSLVIAALFYVLLAQLFNLQIIRGEDYRNKQEATNRETLTVEATRGSIYDRLGRPLAVNEPAFSVLMDANAPITAATFYDVVKLFEKNGDAVVDTFPITKSEPYQFSFSGTGTNESRWKADMGFTGKDASLNAADSLRKLRAQFGVPPSLPDGEARKILNLCAMLYLQRYHTYDPITIAYDVKPETVTVIEENGVKYSGIYVDTQYLRRYPEGKYFANIIGYTGGMGGLGQAALDEKLALGYSLSDKIGKTGLELSMEDRLRGTNGSVVAETDSLGRLIRQLPNSTDPKPGNDIYLTMDRDLQAKAYDLMEAQLSLTLQNRLLGVGSTAARDTRITLEQVFRSMVTGNAISVEQIMSSTQNEDSYAVRRYVLSADPKWVFPPDRDFSGTKAIIAAGIDSGAITPQTMLLVMLDQGLITGGPEEAALIQGGGASPLNVFLDKMKAGEITPQMIDMDPCTGSVVVLDVRNGDVLAAAGYPSYDTNELVNNMNVEYYNKCSSDPTAPFVDRPFKEAHAPGSTFKMITAVTAMEKGSITPTSKIYDETVFTAAGLPYLRNYSTVSNGWIDVTKALEVSCNFFFCEAAYRLGNTKTGNPLDSINDLGEYMKYFGLNEDTGVEIGELDAPPDGIDRISCPALKDYRTLLLNPDATSYDREWHDGDTVQTAIGQGYNSYTAAGMAKYFMTLATRGVRYQLHLVDSVVSHDRTETQKTQPVIEASDLPILDSTWDAVYRGMLAVVSGAQGTGANVFRDFGVQVAGKTGTAQENKNRNDHSSFGGFAPFDDPQIAVYVMIPFGDTKANPAVSSQIARDVMAYYFGLGAGPADVPAVNEMTE